jgi:hypothetical protein
MSSTAYPRTYDRVCIARMQRKIRYLTSIYVFYSPLNAHLNVIAIATSLSRPMTGLYLSEKDAIGRLIPIAFSQSPSNRTPPPGQ